MIRLPLLDGPAGRVDAAAAAWAAARKTRAGRLGGQRSGHSLLFLALAAMAFTGATSCVHAEQPADAPLSKDALFDLAGEAAAKKPVTALPATKDALFANDPAEPAQHPSAVAAPGSRAESELPADKAALFAGAEPATEAKPPVAEPKSGLRGYFQAEAARTFASPAHWSKAIGRLELGSQGKLGTGGLWKMSGRVDFNAIYDLDDYYQGAVRDDQRAEFQIRETYMDFSAGDWEWRLGRQNIVWGELVGMFLADVVSAKDMREFFLPDFQILRIPQWAARAEYFRDDYHVELVWIPLPSYDEIGKPSNFSDPGSGADFYPYPPVPGIPTFLKEKKPATSVSRGNIGARVSRLRDGWDVSGFYYSSMNTAATFYPVAFDTYEPRHDRIWQLGGSLAKDVGPAVLKAEAVYTRGRRFNLMTTGDVVKQPMLDWAIGVDLNPDVDTRLNAQFFQSRIFEREADILPDRVENGVSLLVSRALPNKWRAEILLMSSLNRSDWLARPKVSWGFRPNWKWTLGADVFGGPTTGFFGQYDAQDRVYTEVRYDF